MYSLAPSVGTVSLDPLAALASEVVRVMNDERMGSNQVDLATSIVMARPGNGFGSATKVSSKVKDLLREKPELLAHLQGNARPISQADAYAKWENEHEQN